MKNYFLFLFLFAGISTSFGAGIPEPSRPRLMVDLEGNLVSITNPLPVTIASMTASYTLPISTIDLDNSTQTAFTIASGTSQAISAYSGRKRIICQNIGPDIAYFSIGTASPTIGSAFRLISQEKFSVNIGQDYILWFKANTGATCTIIVGQEKD